MLGLSFDDNKNEISAEEYASWLLALDGNRDGIITQSEASIGCTFEVFQSAKSEYEKLSGEGNLG